MRSAVGSVLVCLAVVASPMAAQATPLTYSESVSGDLPAVPSSAFALDVGGNTIVGTTHFAVNFGDPHFDADFDSFAFVLPSATTLSTISLAFATTIDNVSKANIELELCTGISFCGIDSPLLGVLQTLDLLGASPVNIDFGGVLPLASGTYTLFVHGLGIAAISTSAPESWSANYTWTLSVVPEPGTLALLVAGVVALGLALRPRRPAARMIS